jgi:uncharacterized C2H2 Zn-finger protein
VTFVGKHYQNIRLQLSEVFFSDHSKFFYCNGGQYRTEELPEEFDIGETSIDDHKRSLRRGNEGEHEDDFMAYSEWPYDHYEDSFNFEVSVAITKAETDEMTSEISDALKEIDGEKSFPCSLCDKVCKSKGGLTRHTNSKHSEGSSGSHPKPNLCKDDADSFVNKIQKQISFSSILNSPSHCEIGILNTS